MDATQPTKIRSWKIFGKHGEMGNWKISDCLCGEIQTEDHVLKCQTIGSPCPLQNAEDPGLIRVT